jgi:hypothetical protein
VVRFLRRPEVKSALRATAHAARVIHQENGDGAEQHARHVGGDLARRCRGAADGLAQRGQRRQHAYSGAIWATVPT